MNPVSFKIECESIEEYCDRNNCSAPYLVGDIWWAFPRDAVMAVPANLQTFRYLIWNEKYPESTPFELGEIYYQDSIPWKCRRVWSTQMRLSVIYVRTDVYPLFWVYWWFYFRIKETMVLTMRWFVRVLEVWNLAEVRPEKMSCWQDIKFLKWLNKSE
jgi:hypothetical protein